MVRSVGRVALAAGALWLTVAVTGIAVAQDRRQNQPGQFDFYVLSLSWSPSFCEAAGERGTPPQPARPRGGPAAAGVWRGCDFASERPCVSVPAPTSTRAPAAATSSSCRRYAAAAPRSRASAKHADARRLLEAFNSREFGRMTLRP